MNLVKRIFQILAGLWLFAVLVLGIGSAWLQNNPDVAINAAADVVGLDDAESFRNITPATREREWAEKRAAEAGWGESQSLSEDANFKSGGWAD